MTGFRVAQGGACEVYVEPDLVCLGKVIMVVCP